MLPVKKLLAFLQEEEEEEEEEERRWDAGRCLFKTRTQHHRMVGKKNRSREILRER